MVNKQNANNKQFARSTSGFSRKISLKNITGYAYKVNKKVIAYKVFVGYIYQYQNFAKKRK